MDNPRSQLLDLLVKLSFKTGDFTLSSGAKSDYYIDCRQTTLNAQGARLTGRVVLDVIRENGWKCDAIGGLTLGADPMVISAAVLSASEGTGIDGFLVRKSEKQHGMQQKIEGFSKKGARVVIVDDVCTTGASTVQGIEAAKAAGMEVVGVICLVEREAAGRKNVEAAASPAKMISVFTVADLRERSGRAA